MIIAEGCTNHRCQVAVATKSFSVAPSVFFSNLSIGFPSRHPSAAHNPEETATFLENPCTPATVRRCATSRTVPGSIPGVVTGFFSDIFPSDQTMAPGVDSAPSENEYQECSWG